MTDEALKTFPVPGPWNYGKPRLYVGQVLLDVWEVSAGFSTHREIDLLRNSREAVHHAEDAMRRGAYSVTVGRVAEEKYARWVKAWLEYRPGPWAPGAQLNFY